MTYVGHADARSSAPGRTSQSARHLMAVKRRPAARTTDASDRPGAGPRVGHDFSRVAVHEAGPLTAPSTATGPLPHRHVIERFFGPDHDLSSVRTWVGGPAVGWNASLGASAFTCGEHIAFRSPPSVEEAAHEATHVVQQRQGVRPPGMLSAAGDAWERKADAVAQKVSRRESATDLLGPPAPPLHDAHPPLQRRLVAHGSDADITRFFAIAEPASGVTLSRDPVTHVVTAIASSAAGPTSPAFAAVLTAIIDDPAQNAEAQFGTHQVAPLPAGGVGGVFVGAFPIAAPTVQVIDLDDLEAVETGAPGRGVAFLAHELQENFAAHALPVGMASFSAAHAAGNVAEQAVAADLVGPGTELLEYLVPNAAGGTSFIEDYETYFVVVDFAAAPAPPLTSALPDNVVTGARHVPQTVLSTATIDAFPTGVDAVPATGAAAVAAAAALLVANPTAAVHVEGFTDDVGLAANNAALGQRRANSGRALFPAALLNRVAAIGRGAAGFVAPNITEADRSRNRRIVITVVRP